METITINIHELNKLLQEKVKTNPFFTYHLSKELLEEVKALNMHIVSCSLPNLETRNFEVKRLTDKLYKEDDYFGRSNFTQGFRAAFVWLRLAQTENG